MNKRITYLIITLIVGFFCKAQINQQRFLDDFNKSDLKNKVRIVANSKFEDIKEVYPKIKDTLDHIKRIIYNNTESKEAKFLFDKIEADIEMYNSNYAKAIFILENSLDNHAQTTDDSLTCLILLKASLLKIQDYIKAFEANRLIEKIAHRKSKNFSMDFGAAKSTLFYNIGLTKEAIKQRRVEYNKQYNPNDTDLIVGFYNDMGVFYNNIENTDSAEVYFIKAKQLLNTIKVPEKKIVFYTFFKGLVDGNLGNCYFISGQVRTAIPFIKNDVYGSIMSKNFESASNAYQLLAKCYIDLNEPASAKQYIDSAAKLVSTYNIASKSSLNFILLKADYYNLTNDYKNASENYLDYIKLRDSINVADKERQMLNEEVAFNVEQKEIEIAEKNATLELNKLNDAKQKTFRAYLLAGILMLIGIIVFLILNNRYVKKREEELSIKNMKINNQNILIEQSLKEKELLIKEIHHRVKNNLQIVTSMLSLQIGKINDEKTESILREAKQRISSIALTHQMLYQKDNLSNIILGEYVEKLVRQIEASLPNTSITLETNITCKDKRVSIDNAVPLGLLINEVLTNAYKHAFPNNENGTISVSLFDNNANCKLVIADNGVGLPLEIKETETPSMGMELIQILAEQLDANLIIERELGTKFILDLKADLKAN
ncbi:MAG: sensor histidine kinase [Bacteroidota bacterium]|nr:sensor histidine kinase [Bacteroidota bacterium]